MELMKKEQLDDNSAMLDKLLECNTCKDIGRYEPYLRKKRKKKLHYEEAIDYLVHNLPTLQYVRSQVINFLFSDGLTTGTEAGDRKLDSWLYDTNIRGDTNISVLMEAVSESLVYGKNGVRWLSEDDGIINVPSWRYGAIKEDNKEYYGFKDVIGYILSMEDQKIWDIDTDEVQFDEDVLKNQGVIIDRDRKIILLSNEEFLNMRMETSTTDGESVLNFDRQRIELLVNLYERMNYDVEYDGPGRIIFKLKEGYKNAAANETSTSELINTSPAAQKSRTDMVDAEIQGLAKQIRDSNSDNIIVASDIFDEFEHLPRVTKTTEFLTFLQDNEGVIMSQVFGIPPALLSLGKISGNISMEKIIDNAMLNIIIPMREKIAVQISNFIAPKIGVEKIYFDKYNMKQSNDENDTRVKVVDMIVKLTAAGYTSLADKLAMILDTDLGTIGKLKTLRNRFTGVKENLLKFFKEKGSSYGKRNDETDTE